MRLGAGLKSRKGCSEACSITGIALSCQRILELLMQRMHLCPSSPWIMSRFRGMIVEIDGTSDIRLESGRWPLEPSVRRWRG